MNQKLEIQVAKILNFSEESMDLCAHALQASNLVAFPTETVYGLGANALDEKALEKIFFAKGRPKSDPLIVHISEIFQAESLTEMTSFQRHCFDILGKKFWPGPLTLIVKASKNIPKLITAGGDSIAIRIPSGKIALSLLKKVNFPIAAPSANRFGHVSPTKASHVYDDLGSFPDLYIINQIEECDIGIESTVVKISENNEISILRPGAISSLQLNNVLNENKVNIKVNLVKREVKIINEDQELSTNLDSPGQLLTHYSPNIESFIIKNNELKLNKNIPLFSKNLLSKSVLIDFNSKNLKFKELSLCYLDLSDSGDSKEASKNLFHFLRKAEIIENAEFILLPDLNYENNENLSAIFDRIYRATSGKYVLIN